MAKRELSSTLRNLKFMNRAAQKEEKAKKEVEIKGDGNFASPSQTKKCMVIMEGNPPPGALKGRMSFQSFNPSIDKLNEEATNLHRQPVSTPSPPDCGSGSSPMSSEATFVSRTTNDFDGDYKRKQPENGDHNEQQQRHHPNKSSRNASDGSPNNRNGSDKKQQNHKLNWNLLKPPKPQNKRS